MTKLYELSATGREYPVGFHQSDYERSGSHFVMGDTPDEAKKALEAYLGKGWTANENVRELKELNKLPLEQRILVLAELRHGGVIGIGGKVVKKYTAEDMENTLGKLAGEAFEVLACSREEAANWFYTHKIPCFGGSYTPSDIFAKDKASFEIILGVLKAGVSLGRIK